MSRLLSSSYFVFASSSLSSAFRLSNPTADGHLRLLLPRPATCSPSRVLRSFISKPIVRCSCSSSMSFELSTSSFQDDHLRDSLRYSRAYWVSESVIAWNVDISYGSCYLYASKTAALSVTYDGLQGGDVRIKLEEDTQGLPANVTEKFPHIRDYKAFKVPLTSDAKSLVKCQLAVGAFNYVRTICMGLAASIGSFILVGGKITKRLAFPQAWHQ